MDINYGKFRQIKIEQLPIVPNKLLMDKPMKLEKLLLYKIQCNSTRTNNRQDFIIIIILNIKVSNWELVYVRQKNKSMVYVRG